jgi:hypothetical protein
MKLLLLGGLCVLTLFARHRTDAFILIHISVILLTKKINADYFNLIERTLIVFRSSLIIENTYTIHIQRCNYSTQNNNDLILIIGRFIALCHNIDFVWIYIKFTYINIM